MSLKNRVLTIGLILLLGTPLISAERVLAKQLTLKQAQELVLNIPIVLSDKKKGGCPTAELGWINEKSGTVFLSVRNPCDRSGSASNKIGNFTVDLKNGEIWSGVDRYDDGHNVIDSPRLKELRGKLFAQKK